MPTTLSNDRTVTWVTRPERPKGAKDEVKRPQGPPARSRGPEGPRLLVVVYFMRYNNINTFLMVAEFMRYYTPLLKTLCGRNIARGTADTETDSVT